jgi:Tropinone reductase 1
MDPNRWRLDGQLALVTGGSAGIGRAIARELLGFGAEVLIVARDAAALDRTRDELADEVPDGIVHALVADVVDE